MIRIICRLLDFVRPLIVLGVIFSSWIVIFYEPFPKKLLAIPFVVFITSGGIILIIYWVKSKTWGKI